MNPIIKKRNIYYVIGFKFFQMNFYNSLIDKIKNNLGMLNINNKIGHSIDVFVENIFKEISKNNNYEVFLGNYNITKKINAESDLLLKTEKNIILIENKNKFLTSKSFSGSSADIKKVLRYDNQNIVKISLSANNWFNIMNNSAESLRSNLLKIRFKDYEKCGNNNDFERANDELDKLDNVINTIANKESPKTMRIIHNQSVFIPLELIVNNYKDKCFLEILGKLPSINMDVGNVLDIYDYAKYLSDYKES